MGAVNLHELSEEIVRSLFRNTGATTVIDNSNTPDLEWSAIGRVELLAINSPTSTTSSSGIDPTVPKEKLVVLSRFDGLVS
jgi:hypothetical protein